jgi:protein-S-isoprenylcysteine O-methyltransferase Ste14
VDEVDVPAKVHAQLFVVHEVLAVNFVNDASFGGHFGGAVGFLVFAGAIVVLLWWGREAGGAHRDALQKIIIPPHEEL